MPYYKQFSGKPPHRRDSIGPEEGYRSRRRPTENTPASSGTDRPAQGGRPAFSKDAPRAEGRPYHAQGAGRAPGRPAFSKDAPRAEGRPYHAEGADRAPGRPAFSKDAPRAEGRPYHAEGAGRAPGRPAFSKDAPRAEGRPYHAQGAGRAPGRPYRPARPARPEYEARPVPSREVRPVEPTLPPFIGEEELPRENLLMGRNPIREALKAGRDIEKLLVARGELVGSAREIVAMAHERHIVVQEVDRVRLDAIAPNHQGLIAFASAYKYSTVEEMLEAAHTAQEPPFLIILDGVTDPHNLGAIIRTAECAGAHGVIIPERRAVGLTPAAVKASAGAVEHLRVARAGNLTRLIETLKAEGIWVIAACLTGEPYDQTDLSGPVALIIGGEGDGVSRLVQEHADHRVALPLKGRIESLNASVAAGILMYEVLRSRKA